MRQSIGAPEAEYDLILSSGTCTPPVQEALLDFLERTPHRRILLYGGGITGRAVRACLGERFAGFVDTATLAGTAPEAGDCVVITTSPVHVGEVEASLAGSPLASLPVFRLFRATGPEFRLILETQPRCGTGYVMNNLTRSLGMGFATTFDLKGGLSTDDGLVRYQPGEFNGYVVKAHFTKTLHYPRYRYVPTLFLTGYFPDTYYRWARMQAGLRGEDKQGYFLRADSPEWQRVKGYIPLHLDWLDYIRRFDFIRYEDFYSDFEGTMDVFERLLGVRPRFETPRVITDRIYWSGGQGLMDSEVWSHLAGAFADSIRRYYPEKSGE